MLLTLDDIRKSYTAGDAQTQVLRGVTLELEPGATMALMGESGSGKSTLLHLAGGLDLPDQGRIDLGGEQVNVASDTERAKLRARAIGIVFQQFNLVPSLTIEANIAFQARLAGTYDAAWCAELSGRIGLDTQLGKYPEALSGGQQQRVAIARALAGRPKLILADEPTGNLDEATADIVLDLLLGIARDTGTSVLMVTHSARHAGALDQIKHLSNGQIVS